MRVRITREAYYPAGWVIRYPPLKVGTVVPVVPATNLPDYKEKGLVWVDTEELKDDAYGILLSKEDGDYEVVPDDGEHCPQCGAKHTEACIEGGRCSKCGTMLCSVKES